MTLCVHSTWRDPVQDEVGLVNKRLIIDDGTRPEEDKKCLLKESMIRKQVLLFLSLPLSLSLSVVLSVCVRLRVCVCVFYLLRYLSPITHVCFNRISGRITIFLYLLLLST